MTQTTGLQQGMGSATAELELTFQPAVFLLLYGTFERMSFWRCILFLAMLFLCLCSGVLCYCFLA